MPKNTKASEPKEPSGELENEDPSMQVPPDMKLPKKVKEKLDEIKSQVEKFKDHIVKKFDKYILGVALLPPPKPKEGEAVDKDKIYVLVAIDDSDSKKMSKEELKDKLIVIIEKMAVDVNKNLIVETVLLSEVWQSCYDGKYELMQKIALCAPVFDKGLLRTIKVTEVHKTMVLKKFEKYIVSYVLFGSIYKGTSKEESDIDIFIIVDDTDVKRMTRGELRDKLRAIMYGMAGEAGMMTGVPNKLHLQVWILTDYWEALKESSPVIIDALRDGIPLYDRGMFLPWKQLLNMGKIRPSSEAIEMFMSTGDQALQRIKYKLKDIGMDDIFLAILTPTQAALMLYGVQPPSPKETPPLLREVFVKEGLLEDKYVDILEHNLKVRKDIEYGIKKDIDGKEIDELLKSAEEYLKRIKKLFEDLEKKKELETVENMHEAVVNVTRDVLKMAGVEKAKEEEIPALFEEHLVSTSKISAKFAVLLKELLKTKTKYHSKQTSKLDLNKIRKSSREYIKHIVDYMQRTSARELERMKIRIKSGEMFGEVILTPTAAFIIQDVDHDKKISRAVIAENGSLGPLHPITIEKMDEELAAMKKMPKVAVKPALFESLKQVFGKDAEIFLNY
ncbi:MAG: nucleotidyltransferase domain-containing protein [Candidatus Woesearchaeota archaeon]